MIRISDAAQAHFAKLLANQEEGTQIRVFVINPGTPNAECGVSYCPPDAVSGCGGRQFSGHQLISGALYPEDVERSAQADDFFGAEVSFIQTKKLLLSA